MDEKCTELGLHNKIGSFDKVIDGNFNSLAKIIIRTDPVLCQLFPNTKFRPQRRCNSTALCILCFSPHFAVPEDHQMPRPVFHWYDTL
jgi:hypothetical protein